MTISQGTSKRNSRNKRTPRQSNSESKFERNRLLQINKEMGLYSPELAKEIGIYESIILLQLAFWIAIGDDSHFRDGTYWTYQSLSNISCYLPKSKPTLNRVIHRLINKGLILVRDDYNQKKYDYTRWFAINLSEIAKLKSVSIKSNSPMIAKIKDGTSERAAVERIFRYWQKQMNKPHAKLTRGRERKIIARLDQGYTEEEIKQAIDGCYLSDFHMGRSDRGTAVYNDLTLICRNGSKLEQFIAIAKAANEPLLATTNYYDGGNGREQKSASRRRVEKFVESTRAVKALLQSDTELGDPSEVIDIEPERSVRTKNDEKFDHVAFQNETRSNQIETGAFQNETRSNQIETTIPETTAETTQTTRTERTLSPSLRSGDCSLARAGSLSPRRAQDDLAVSGAADESDDKANADFQEPNVLQSGLGSCLKIARTHKHPPSRTRQAEGSDTRVEVQR
jgi:hypothetical protein